MTKKIASLKDNNNTNTNARQCSYEQTNPIVTSPEFIDFNKLEEIQNIAVISKELLKNLETNSEVNRILRSSDALIYIPVVFLTVATTHSDLEQRKITCINNAEILVNHCNAIFEGNSTNKVDVNNHSGNHGTINNNSNHLENSNVRFFLPYKIPKEQLHPFAKSTKFSSNIIIEDYNTYLSQLVEGITISDSYNSQYTYDDIKAQRELVKNIADGSRSRNTNFEIGDEYEGGYIFQINEDGTGLVADLQDLGLMDWNSAMDAAENATSQGYEDWYLPSKDELVEMYNTIGNGGLEGDIGGFNTTVAYWSSSEFSSTVAYYVYFNNGYAPNWYKYRSSRVRVIRQVILPSSTPSEVTTLAEMEDDYFFYFGNSPGVIFFKDFSDKEGFMQTNPYQIMNIAINQNPEIGGNFSTGIAQKPAIYSAWSSGGNVVAPSFLNSITAVRFNSQTKNHNSMSGLNGSAYLGNALNLNQQHSAINLTSLHSSQNNSNILKSYHSTFLHEFLHTIGFSHGHDGVTLSGTSIIGNRITSYLSRSRSSYLAPWKRYGGFYPPFKYYDATNVNHNLEDENTLPDYEIIDPNEKLFVEAAIKTVQNNWTAIKNITNEGLKYIPYYNSSLVEDFSSVPAPYVPTSTFSSKPQLVRYAKLFGLISHLPTFWGGSYTTNEDGSKSMLINPTDEEGLRKGPNITVRNAVCRKDDNTKVNLRMFFTLEWYDDTFPAFPDNTKVEDMFSPDICPCLYEDQTIAYAGSMSVNNGDTFLNYTFKFFTPKINETTGEEINTTTGDHVWSAETSRILKLHYTWDIEKIKSYNLTGAAYGNYMSNNLFAILFGEGSNEANNMYDYIGSSSASPKWIINVGTSIKPLYIPNFPIYIGFVPEAPIPKNIKYDPEKTYTLSDEYSNVAAAAKEFILKNEVNDNSLYNSWGYGFRTFVDKYFRIGSIDPDSDLYNPFKYDTSPTGTASFVSSELTALGKTHEDWQNYYIQGGDMKISYHNSSSDSFTNTIFKEFYKRKVATGLFDSLEETMHGKLDINTFANIMYYNSGGIEPLLPSKNQMQRLNYLIEDNPQGPFKVMKNYIEDLFDLNNGSIYEDYLPDVDQKNNTLNTVQDYIDVAMDYVEENRIDQTDAVVGCRNPNAFNYNPDAEIHDSGMCIAKVFGCMNPEAENYNEDANVDNGLCAFYSLQPKPVLAVYVCPSTITNACNTNTEEKEMFVVQNAQDGINTSMYQQELNEYFDNVEDLDYEVEGGDLVSAPYYSFENMPSQIEHKAYYAILDSESGYWRYLDVINYINFFRYSGPNCPNLLASEDPDYGSLNVGGGCVNIADYSVCEFPEVTKQGCQVLTDIEITSSEVSFIDGESQIMSTDDFIAYFNGLSSNSEYSVGVCNNNSNIS